MKIPRIMIAAPSSGSGKTLVTCGILKALQKRGQRPVSFKCGPDFIDPMFHERVLGVPADNLDLFLCGREKTMQILRQHYKQADIAVMEGVMGYYDGWSLDTDNGSSFAVAALTETPVILVISCKGMGLSIVPMIEGFMNFREGSRISGVILNGISKMLFMRLKELIESRLPLPVIGYVPVLEELHFDSRHLGLVMPGEVKEIETQLELLGTVIEETVDMDKLLEIANKADKILQKDTVPERNSGGSKKPVQIAVARDDAFCFYYKANLELLKQLGCELVPFSPLTDKKLPAHVQGLLLGGGYPELYAKELSENRSMLCSMRDVLHRGLPCIAECGGFMYLHEEMESKEGNLYPLTGIVKGRAFRTKKLVRFGYITITAQEDQVYQKAGERLRAHEFHYWDSTDSGSCYLAEKPDGKRKWNCIHVDGNLFAGYPHIHLCSNQTFAQKFVEVCSRW